MQTGVIAALGKGIPLEMAPRWQAGFCHINLAIGYESREREVLLNRF